MVGYVALIISMAFAALLGAGGQILLKIGSSKVTLLKMIPWFFGFAALYGVAVLINIWAYKSGGKVTFVYPIISLSYIMSALLAWKFLGEPISWMTFVGAALIMTGITFMLVSSAGAI